jgi:5-methylcytosine-specific restriction enzyme subunit McrC
MKFLKTQDNKHFFEHHHCYSPEVISEEAIPVIPDPIFFRNGEGICVEINKYNRVLQTNYYVGIDWINEITPIYVEPKINNGHDQTDYLAMLFSALKHPEIENYTDDLFEIKWDSPQIEINQQQDLLTPLLVVQFLKVVQAIVRKGLKKSYYKVEQNLNSKVKGKILVGKTIKQNLLKNKPLKTFCTYNEFGLNGLENRLIKKTLLFVQRYLPTIKNLHSEKYTANLFNYINPAFDFVSEEVSLHDVKHTKTNVFYKEYNEAIKLAKQILRRFGYNINNTQETNIKTPPFWIDMSKLFELYVLGLFKEKYGNEICFQYGENRNETTYGQPDFLLLKVGEKMIIDAKYKQHYQAENISFTEYLIKDIRQLSGYARDKGILLKLGFSKEEQKNIVPECLIIYPDQSKSENIWKNEEKAIEGFIKFSKRPIKLPTIPSKNTN